MTSGSSLRPNIPGIPGTDERRTFWTAALLALTVEFLLLTLFGGLTRLSPRSSLPAESTRFLEAEVLEIPPQAHLTEEKKIAAPVKEAVLSKVPNQGKKADSKPELTDKNQTAGGPPPVAPTHGPIAYYAPAPVIPAYLRNQEINGSAVIDFFITSAGMVTPKLVASSGNEELDALAVATAKKWQFHPAEQDHHPTDSKIRLRIIFQVK